MKYLKPPLTNTSTRNIAQEPRRCEISRIVVTVDSSEAPMKAIVLPVVTAVTLAIAPAATYARSAGANPGGMSASHISSQGAANTNGPNATDRDKGLERAGDRMSAQGQAHAKSTQHTSTHHGKKKQATSKG